MNKIATLPPTTEPVNPKLAQTREHWSKLARVYHQMETPLHPSYADIVAMERFVAHAIAERNAGDQARAATALLLGVTPAIATMAWPQQTHVLAFDNAPGMLEVVWPGDLPRVRTAREGNWLNLPLADKSCAVAIGDGSFNCLDFPDGYQQLASSVARVLEDDGVLVLRVYARPEKVPPVADLFRDLVAGRFATFDGFKFQIYMTLADKDFNFAVRTFWEQWVQADLDEQLLCQATGWPATKFENIPSYEHSLARYSFPPLGAIEAMLAQHFERIDIAYPTYALGECCPTLLLRKRR
ncbi:MAG: class I SAM-dependent methyltransferase [Caldilineaceae bacterium]|nr:class I SAM-dependent methyltransferase [Caldilineaceae bacterium]